MIEHHYAVIYNSTTGGWYVCEEDIAFPDGIIYDTSEGRFRPLSDEVDEVNEDIRAYRLLHDALIQLSNQTNKLEGL